MPSRSPRKAPQVLELPVTRSGPVTVGKTYIVARPQYPARPAVVLESRVGKHGAREAYVSFVGEDKRLDTWVLESQIGEEVGSQESTAGPSQAALLRASRASATVDVHTQGGPSRPSPSAPSTPEREHATMTRVRNFEDVRFGEYLIKTWYYSPYPRLAIADERATSPTPHPVVGNGHNQKRRKLNGDHPKTHHVALEIGSSASKAGLKKERSVQDIYAASMSKAGEGVRGRIWVCDLCFKYMRTRGSWERHISTCDMMTPPGRRVYQKGSYTMWEVDGAQAPLYCQNLSLFGKLFIDHKSVFFYVENFLFYVLCDAATSRRDQVMAFFSKEKISYDDHNLACIITFPPFQNRGFGKLLIEFSYYLTAHPNTRPLSLSPGTPERPLSDLGLKGYTAYWISVILRVCRDVLAGAPPLAEAPPVSPARLQRPRRTSTANGLLDAVVDISGVQAVKAISHVKGQYSVSLTLSDLAKACHLRLDDVVSTLTELGFLRHRRRLSPSASNERSRRHQVAGQEEGAEPHSIKAEEAGEDWSNVEIVISRDAVDREWAKWKVRPKGVLDESCVLL